MQMNVKNRPTLPMNDSIPLKNYAFYLHLLAISHTEMLSSALITSQILKVLLSVIVNIRLNHRSAK